MNTASLELCKELYELSGWGSDPLDKSNDIRDWYGHPTDLKGWICPKYDAGFLLRKLPPHVDWDEEQYTFGLWRGTKGFSSGYGSIEGEMVYYGEDETELFFTGDTPENALCKLAIELFKQGILPPQQKGNR